MTPPSITALPQLPAELATLDFLPVELRDRYSRDLTGAFQLRWISADDAVNTTVHLERIASGKVEVLPAGETPATLAARDTAAREQHAEMLRELERLEAKQQSDRAAEREAQRAAERDALDAEARRHRASYGF